MMLEYFFKFIIFFLTENSRRRRRGDRHDRDRPLPPLLARVGGNIEVKATAVIFYQSS